MTTIVFQDTKDLQPHPRAFQIISIVKINHMVDCTENSDLQVRGQGLDLLGKTYRMPKSKSSRSRSPRNITDRLLKSKRSSSPAVRSTFHPSRDQPTYSGNTSTPNVRVSSGKSVPSASTLNRHFPMEEGRK